MPVERLQNAYYVVGDMEASRHFWETVLGLPRKFADGDRWVQLSAGGVNVALAGRSEAPPAATGAVLVFQVDNLDGDRRRLTDAGIAILGERDMGDHGRTLTIADPDGNILQLYAPPSPRPAAAHGGQSV
ncbi:glyoxalase/bleomycin resistance/dioxygenase family protein [Siculibacillus lacustris]|uniref:Glyoxalase/bleomycin resistance/dioxygenase family protein n=1 Tax=Siculibacillus lacustris TaxID=1549641 RepID=A0A4Q9VLK6_9HYPH|nr:VOC family protein [Siculibacillus lacustris]TBW35491.1 glyoxalase/bleomycin resistance/dioxygenase family protein [Siculibacillus lacustris]